MQFFHSNFRLEKIFEKTAEGGTISVIYDLFLYLALDDLMSAFHVWNVWHAQKRLSSRWLSLNTIFIFFFNGSFVNSNNENENSKVQNVVVILLWMVKIFWNILYWNWNGNTIFCIKKSNKRKMRRILLLIWISFSYKFDRFLDHLRSLPSTSFQSENFISV